MYGKRTSKFGSDDYSEKIPFNSSFAKLDRINLWWTNAGRAKGEGMIDLYYNMLENIYTELYAHLTTKEQDEINADLLVIESYLDNNMAKGNKVISVRNASNLCDKLARKLSTLSKKYELEWFDIREWSRKQREMEPIVGEDSY